MCDPVQTTSDNLCKLVRWAHSHGTICNLIPSLQHLTCGSYVLTPEPGAHGSGVSVAVWGCDAGHAYHWPLSEHGNNCRGSANTSQGQERFVGGRPSNKVKRRFEVFCLYDFEVKCSAEPQYWENTSSCSPDAVSMVQSSCLTLSTQSQRLVLLASVTIKSAGFYENVSDSDFIPADLCQILQYITICIAFQCNIIAAWPVYRDA